jgi:hypothetical protein
VATPHYKVPVNIKEEKGVDKKEMSWILQSFFQAYFENNSGKNECLCGKARFNNPASS